MEEKMRILKMLEDGTITADEAFELMNALSSTDVLVPSDKPYNKRMLKILVSKEGGDNVTVQFPVGAVKKILKVTGKLPIPEDQLQGFDLSELMDAISECLDEELDGDIINVNSVSEAANVRICIE